MPIAESKGSDYTGQEHQHKKKTHLGTKKWGFQLVLEAKDHDTFDFRAKNDFA